MAVTATPSLVQTPKVGLVQIVAADASTKKTIATAGANGAKVVSVQVASDDTAARIFQLFITRSAVNYLVGSYSVPASCGFDGVLPAVDMLRGGPLLLIPGMAVDNDGQSYLFLENGDTLTCSVTTTVTAAKTIHVVATFGNF